jgi:hypothetical protein
MCIELFLFWNKPEGFLTGIVVFQYIKNMYLFHFTALEMVMMVWLKINEFQKQIDWK